MPIGPRQGQAVAAQAARLQALDGAFQHRGARAVEAVAVASLNEHRPDRRLAANVEFYTAVILDAVGLPQDLFTATFAVACERILMARQERGLYT